MKQEHISWLKKTTPSLLEGMLEHTKELDERGERHLYGTATNHIRLLLECVEYLEEKTMKHYTAEDVEQHLEALFPEVDLRCETANDLDYHHIAELINAAVKEAVEAEREACAKAIRARGAKE